MPMIDNGEMKSDPLKALLTWPIDVRQKVRDALLPWCWINCQHEIRWRKTTNNKVLLSALWKLACGTIYEMGFTDDGQICAGHALELVNIIWGKNDTTGQR